MWLEQGYHVSASGRNGVRTLHFLGDCYMVPGVDYFRFEFVGKLMPSTAQFDGVCKLCSKKGAVRVHEFSGTETSSSTLSGRQVYRVQLDGTVRVHGADTRRQSLMMDVPVVVLVD